MGFKIHYKQTVSDGQSTPVSQDYTIDTFDSVWDISPLNSPWANSGCYAGAMPANGSEIGSYSVATWSGWNKDSVYSDMRDMTIRSYGGSGQQNLRFMAKYNSASFTVNKQSFNWTNLRDNTVRVISNAVESFGNYTEYDPYKRQDKQMGTVGTSNSPLNVAPLESLQINNLIFVPLFRINEIEYYGYDDVVGGYANVSSSSTTNYTWSQIKPQDKTPAGEYYDADLFERGWKEITATHEDGRRFRYCCGVELTPYYGKCSKAYNQSTDTYTDGTNPDDGKVYGDRQVFGSAQSQTDEYPVISSITNLNRPCLLVMTESYDSVTGGLTYTLPAGISFNNNYTTGSVSGNLHALQPSWSLTSDFKTFSATSSWTSNFYTHQQNTCNFYADVDPSSSNTSPDLSITSTVLNIDINISSLYDISGFPTSIRYYLPNNNPVAFSFTRSNRNVTATNVAFYSINSLWHTIASLGCYVADSTATAQKAPTGYYTGSNNHLYLGHMDANGITDGVMLQGGDIPSAVQSGIDDIIQNTPYTPVKPGPSGGGDDPSTLPTPSGKGEAKLTGATTKGSKNREFGSGSITYYALSISDAATFKSLLWAQTKTFYNAIQISGKQNTSIFDYISSYRYYPTDITSLGISLGAASDIHLGTGAVFKQVNGTEYKLQPLSNFYSQFSWCSWDLSSFSGWRKNFLDYSPYCKLAIYLPYAGTFDLDVQTVAAMVDITTATINVDVCIDINTGSLTYYVDANGYMILDKTLKLGVDLPLSGNDAIQQSVAILQANYHNGSQVIGMTADLAAASGDALSALTTVAQLPLQVGQMSLASALASRQIPTQVGGFGGTLSTVTMGQDPYITIYRQKIANPDNFGHVFGYLTESKHTIADLSGWTVCSNVDLTGISATSTELSMIAQILQSGFYA